jgi:hypothetical protein
MPLHMPTRTLVATGRTCNSLVSYGHPFESLSGLRRWILLLTFICSRRDCVPLFFSLRRTMPQEWRFSSEPRRGSLPHDVVVREGIWQEKDSLHRLRTPARARTSRCVREEASYREVFIGWSIINGSDSLTLKCLHCSSFSSRCVSSPRPGHKHPASVVKLCGTITIYLARSGPAQYPDGTPSP